MCLETTFPDGVVVVIEGLKIDCEVGREFEFGFEFEFEEGILPIVNDDNLLSWTFPSSGVGTDVPWGVEVSRELGGIGSVSVVAGLLSLVSASKAGLGFGLEVLR